jgi:hypothetical protein
MQDRETSYWLTVLLGGPFAGVMAGAFWTIWMALLVGPTLRHWLFGGALFSLFIIMMITALNAFQLRQTRREWRVSGDTEARRRLVATAACLNYVPALEEANYVRLRRMGFKVKPVCSNVEVWFMPDAVVIDGPHGPVTRLTKRLAKSA